MAERLVGEVFDYLSKVEVAAIRVSGDLKVGDKIRIKGATTDLDDFVSSMQVEGNEVECVRSGDKVGIKVSDRVRRNDKVFVVEE
jgi:putative protease